MKLLRAAVLACALAAPLHAVSAAPGGLYGAAESGFGRALAIDGNDVLVGEAANQTKPGAVYVYRKVNGKWSEVTRINASDASPNDGFGFAIAIDGNTMVVSSMSANDNKGALYVFTKDSRGAWREQAKLTADNQPGENFGQSVAIQGDVIAVGAPITTKSAGAVHVFRRTGSTWAHEATLTSAEPKDQMFFGGVVGIAHGRILASETRTNENRGAVRVFSKDGNEWKLATSLTANGLQPNDRFGAPLTVDNGRIFVSAYGYNSGAGAVFRFDPDTEGQWHEAARYVAYDGRPSDQFGSAIAASGEHLWVGAPRANAFKGTVYHIWKSSTDSTLTGAERMSGGELGAQAFFGATLAASPTLAAANVANADFGLGAVAIYEYATGKWSAPTILRGADDRLPSIAGKKVDCTNGKAAQFDCNGVQLMSYLSVPDMGGSRGVQLNDIWGWTDPQTGKEWALVGRMDGTSFVDVSNPERPLFVANLPMTKGANAAAWRDIKVYKNHAYIVADGSGAHGMQVFDLTRLRTTKPGTVVEADMTYRRINSSHNIVINEETGYAYAVGVSGGGETCGGGLHMIDIREPKNPRFAGCFADPQTGRANTGYSHDAQCVVYKGPDEKYRGHEICLGSNETMLSIADVTDKSKPVAISRASYPNVGYSHQGWLDEDHRYFYMDDELDELSGSTPKTRTIIWDLTKLDDPQVATMYLSPTSASDHNLYIKGDTMYQSHYVAGLRVVNIKNRTAPEEVGFFDTVPYGSNTPGFGGSWSNYPYFKSGIIIATSMNEGLFVLKKADPKPVL